MANGPKTIFSYQSSFVKILISMVVILLTASAFAVAVCGILLPNQMMDGGVTGVSIMLAEVTGISLSVFLVIVNLPFVIFAFFKKTKIFTFLSVYGIACLAIVTELLHNMKPLIEDDKLLALIFGSPVIGVAVGLAIRYGGVLDGLEILAVFLSKKFTSVSTGGVLISCNVVIFGIGSFVFSLESALYSCVMFAIATYAIGRVEMIGSEIIRLSINSDKPMDIIDFLVSEGYQATYQHVFGAYTKKERIIVVTNIPKTDSKDVIEAIHNFDPHAYMSQVVIKEIRGSIRKNHNKDELDESQIA